MHDLAEALTHDAAALATAAENVDDLALRNMLKRRSVEYRRAHEAAVNAQLDGNCFIVLPAGSIEPGFQVMTRDGDSVEIVRVLLQNGAPSAQVRDDSGYTTWQNWVAPSSPVVVLTGETIR